MTATARSSGRHGTRVCAHRGDSSQYQENTLPAIRSALAASADFVEIDVRVTADGAVVVLHDATLNRLWGVDAQVADLTWSQLRELGNKDNRLPLLVEVLELFGNSSSTLLIDMETAEPAEAAYRVAAGSDAPIAWCGHADGMRIIRSLDPSARIWMPWDLAYSPTMADIDDLGPEYINSDFLYLSRAMVEDVHALGCKVAVWTVDDESTMRWAIGLGVDCVTTNQLEQLQEIVTEEPSGGAGPDTARPSDLDLDEALAVARELGQWAINFASSSDPGHISTKKDAADLVTEVDVAVERHVREFIGQRFGTHGFVGEEMGGAAVPGVPCWYLDPVDGTTNLANGIPWNAFSLALVLDHIPLVGVVADPWRGDLFAAVRGRGAELNALPLKLSSHQPTADPLLGRVVSTELANHLAWPGMLEMLAALGERHCTMRIMGSGTMTLVGVAAGRGVGAVIGRFGPVDHLAAALIVSEAGGVVLDSTGQRNPFPTSGGILAAAPEAAGALYDLWRDACSTAERNSARLQSDSRGRGG